MSKWRDIYKLASKGNLKAPRRVEKTDAEWKEILTEEEFYVTRQKGTERANSSQMCSIFEAGLYACKCCHTPLFDSTVKFDSGTGWPSFAAPVEDSHVAYHKDVSFGMTRIEATCNICDAHLGHVFQDGPEPTGLRYCINAMSLRKRKVFQEEATDNCGPDPDNNHCGDANEY